MSGMGATGAMMRVTPISRMIWRLRHAVLLLWVFALAAAEGQAQVLALQGGTAHTLAGDPVPNATIVIENGRITAVGAQVNVPANAEIIDVTGLHVYPGLFDAFSQLGLTEIDALAVTNDFSELGDFNPNLLAFTAVHPPSEHIPVARANGITHAITAPTSRSGGVGGQPSLISLDGWTVEEMLVSPSVGFVLDWPTVAAGRGGRTYTEAKEDYDGQIRRLAGWLEDARRYDLAVRAEHPIPRDLKLEAFSRLTRRELPLMIDVRDERYIADAIAFAAEEDIRIVILGGSQVWKMAEELARQSIPVILGPTQALPSGADESYDEQYAAPARLFEAGVQFAFATFSSPDSRTLPFQAGNAVPYGLPHDEALKAITLRAAEIYGVDDQLGTIETGKRANLIVTDGDPLEYTTTMMRLIIEGREVSFDNRHLELYETYRDRPLPLP
jgi:imidazolonepropionase-like amidohydrolase